MLEVDRFFLTCAIDLNTDRGEYARDRLDEPTNLSRDSGPRVDSRPQGFQENYSEIVSRFTLVALDDRTSIPIMLPNFSMSELCLSYKYDAQNPLMMRLILEETIYGPIIKNTSRAS